MDVPSATYKTEAMRRYSRAHGGVASARRSRRWSVAVKLVRKESCCSILRLSLGAFACCKTFGYLLSLSRHHRGAAEFSLLTLRWPTFRENQRTNANLVTGQRFAQ